MNFINALFCVLVLTVWMSDCRQIHHGTAEENKEMDKNKEYDVSTNERQSLESSYSMDSTQEQDSDFTSSSEYDESHEVRGETPLVNNDMSKSRKREGITANCGADVNKPCCPEKTKDKGDDDEGSNTGEPGGEEIKCICRCNVPAVDKKGDDLKSDDETNPRFCPKGQGSWPDLLPNDGKKKHHKSKYKKP